MDEFSKNYDNVIFLGGFNTSINDNAVKSFCSLNDLTSFIDQPTCYKNPDKPTCTDLMLTNRLNYFQQNNVFETGLSDFHMMVATELKMGFQKLKPHIVAYRDYKHFDNKKFQSDIENCASEKNLKCFKETVFCIFNKHAPIKRKYVRANEAPFMAKELHKAIMKRSRLRNKFLKTKSITDRKNYNVQRSYCKKLLRSTKKSCFNKLEISKINDNRSFWKTIVPLFTKKNSKSEKINLNEEGKNVSDNAELRRIFNNYFSEVISNLKIPSLINNSAVDQNAVSNPLSIATKLFDQHPSIINIKKKKLDSVLNLKKTSSTEVEKVINNLSVFKACQKDDK